MFHSSIFDPKRELLKLFVYVCVCVCLYPCSFSKKDIGVVQSKQRLLIIVDGFDRIPPWNVSGRLPAITMYKCIAAEKRVKYLNQSNTFVFVVVVGFFLFSRMLLSKPAQQLGEKLQVLGKAQ